MSLATLMLLALSPMFECQSSCGWGVNCFLLLLVSGCSPMTESRDAFESVLGYGHQSVVQCDLKCVRNLLLLGLFDS